MSYARVERHLVEPLVRQLEKSGHHTFFDGDLAAGQEWWDELMTRLEGSEIFLPVLSSRYVTSVPCRLESEYASQIKRVFLPVAIERVPPHLLSERIAKAQQIHYDANSTEALLELMRGINAVGPCPALPDPMPPRPAAPISSLHRIHDLLMSDAALSKDQQLVMLAELKAKYLARDDESEAAAALLRQLRTRRELLYAVGREIDEILGSQPADAAAAPRLVERPLERLLFERPLERPLERPPESPIVRRPSATSAPGPASPVNPVVPKWEPTVPKWEPTVPKWEPTFPEWVPGPPEVDAEAEAETSGTETSGTKTSGTAPWGWATGRVLSAACWFAVPLVAAVAVLRLEQVPHMVWGIPAVFQLMMALGAISAGLTVLKSRGWARPEDLALIVAGGGGTLVATGWVVQAMNPDKYRTPLQLALIAATMAIVAAAIGVTAVTNQVQRQLVARVILLIGCLPGLMLIGMRLSLVHHYSFPKPHLGDLLWFAISGAAVLVGAAASAVRGLTVGRPAALGVAAFTVAVAAVNAVLSRYPIRGGEEDFLWRATIVLILVGSALLAVGPIGLRRPDRVTRGA